MLGLSELCGRLRLKHFYNVAEMSYKTKIGEEVTGEMDEFLFYLSHVAIVGKAFNVTD